MEILLLKLDNTRKEYRHNICDKRFYEIGNNARPSNTGSCCDICNRNLILPMRLYLMRKYNNNANNELIYTIS